MHSIRYALAFAALALPCTLLAQTAQSAEPHSDPYVVDVSVKTPPKPLNAAEKTMIATIDAEAPSSNGLLKQIVDINSGTLNTQGVRDVADVLMPKLKELGFHVEFHSGEAVHRAGNILATHPCPAGPGKCGKRILLIGHMDTVFEKSEPAGPFAIVPGTDGKIATGQGAFDMKGGLIIAIYALRAMQAAGVLKNTEITIVFSGDEESVGKPIATARHDMLAAAQQSDVALEFEATANFHGQDYGGTDRRSSIAWRLNTTGHMGHSGAIFSKTSGYGAIYELTRILDAFRTQLPEPELTYNAGMILGGTQITPNELGDGGSVTAKNNIIPPVALATGDIRTVSEEQTARVEAKMKAIVQQHLPVTGATISFATSYPSMPPTAGNRSLLRMMNTVNQSLDMPQQPETDPLERGAGDVAFVAQYLDALAGVGPVGSGAHSPGEKIDLSRQASLMKRVAVLMYRLSQTDSTKKLTELYPAN